MLISYQNWNLAGFLYLESCLLIILTRILLASYLQLYRYCETSVDSCLERHVRSCYQLAGVLCWGICLNSDRNRIRP